MKYENKKERKRTKTKTKRKAKNQKISKKSTLSVTNFIQLVSPQPVDQFLQTKLCWEASNESYPHICGMYKSNNK